MTRFATDLETVTYNPVTQTLVLQPLRDIHNPPGSPLKVTSPAKPSPSPVIQTLPKKLAEPKSKKKKIQDNVAVSAEGKDPLEGPLPVPVDEKKKVPRPRINYGPATRKSERVAKK